METTLCTTVNGQLKAGFTFRPEYIKRRVSLFQAGKRSRESECERTSHVALENWAKKGFIPRIRCHSVFSSKFSHATCTYVFAVYGLLAYKERTCSTGYFVFLFVPWRSFSDRASLIAISRLRASTPERRNRNPP